MMKAYLFLIITFLSLTSDAKEDTWIAFWDEENHKMGFKDAQGKVKIPPKFLGMTQAREFKNIIAVMEEKDGIYDAYYLLKNGNQIKNVKMFTYDNSFDCESDGKIRFREKVSGAMGYLNDKGDIAIPPIYNTGEPFVNGLASVIKGASLFCQNGEAFSPENRCEHAIWKGGNSLIIDSSNRVVIEGMSLSHELERYSLSISEQPKSSEIIESFQGVNGKYFNFLNIKKHFELWFRKNVLSDLSKANLERLTFDEVALYSGNKGWYKQPNQTFWKNNYGKVRNALNELNKSNSSFFVTLDSINQFIYKEEKYKSFYSYCYNQASNRNPILSVISNNSVKGSSVQNVYNFLKLQDGYELLSITLRTAKIN